MGRRKGSPGGNSGRWGPRPPGTSGNQWTAGTKTSTRTSNPDSAASRNNKLASASLNKFLGYERFDYPEHLKIPVPVDTIRASTDPYAGSKVGELLDKLASFHDDPLGFVKWAFPWGEKGTMLEDMTGPEEWQQEQLTRIGQRIRDGGLEGDVIEEDVSSGHGIGKSAEVSWMILWAISTSADTRGVVTANTDTQLRTKTWAELGKWYQLFIARQLFTLTATALYIAGDPAREKTWRIDQIPWSKERSEALQDCTTRASG